MEACLCELSLPFDRQVTSSYICSYDKPGNADSSSITLDQFTAFIS